MKEDELSLSLTTLNFKNLKFVEKIGLSYDDDHIKKSTEEPNLQIHV